jgi:hypothetical protein
MRGMILVTAIVAACGDKGPQGPLPVDEVVPRAAKLVDKQVKVHGWVVAGSIEEALDEQAQTMRRTFAIQERNATLPARLDGVKPDSFKDNAEFIYTGTLRREGDGYRLDVTDLKMVCPPNLEPGKWCVTYQRP